MDNQQRQAILARDMVDMIRRYADDAVALEYLESFAFSLARLHENDDVVDWDDIAGVCDQLSQTLKEGGAIALNVATLDIVMQRVQREIDKAKTSYRELEEFYEKEVLPKFDFDMSDITWIDHAQIDLDTFAHYFLAGDYEYALRFDDFRGPHTFLDDEGERVPLIAEKDTYRYSNPASKYIENRIGDFTLYRLRPRSAATTS